MSLLSLVVGVLSNCTLMNFKIKADDQQSSFTKNILSTSNAIKTTPVEFATEYNVEFNTEDLVQSFKLNSTNATSRDFDSKLVNDLEAKKFNNKKIASDKPVTQEVDSSDVEDSEVVRSISSNSHIKVFQTKKHIKKSQRSTGRNEHFDDSDSHSEQIRKAEKGRYVVKNGDTLMKISFAKYGNVYKWKNILNSNKDKIVDFNKLTAGTELTIEGDEYVVVEKNGRPYLIRKNDTLVKISNTVYGDIKKWPLLWKNNRQLIHDPNKIYAGFTLYYLDPEDLKIKKAELKSNESERKPSSK